MKQIPPSRIQAFVGAKCPRCHSGHLFVHSPFHPLKFNKTVEYCPVCGVKIEPEPGFFWGAMYFSYALVVGLMIVLGIIMFSIYEDPPMGVLLAAILGTLFLLLPFIFRLSRLLMVYLTAPYRHFDHELYERLKQEGKIL
jgi:uncharacterized protein (DUF983 family)